MDIFNKIKKWLTKKPKNEKVKEANRVTNYGGGVSSKSVQKEVKRSIVKAEAKKNGERQTEYQKSVVSKSNSSAFKATPPSVRKAEAKDRQTSKKSDPFNAKNAFKASAQPKFTHQSTALGTLSKRDIDTRTAKINAYNENRKYQSRAADKLKPLIDEKYSGDTLESKQRIKSGEYWSDPNVMKYETLKHPIAMSAGRGALSGTTFGLSELGIALLPQSKEVEEAERLYQANKSKGAEFAGEMAGSLASFGLTSGASKAAVTKLAPKTTARLGESATEYLAKNGLVRRAAEKEALRKLGTTATKEEIEHFARSKAAKLVAALGEDAAINLTTGAVSDVSHAIIDSDNPVEFLKNMGMNAVGNVVLGGVTSAVPALRGGNVDDAFVRNRLAAREGLDDLAKRNRIGMGRPSELTLPKLNAVSDASDAVARYPAIEDAYLDYDGTIEAVNRYYNPDATAEAAVRRYDDLEAPRRKPRTAEEPKAEPLKSAAEPKSKNWRDSLADSETYDDFVKQNAKNADLKAHMKETGKNPKEVWRDARIERGKQNLHRISDEEADRILWERIPENEVQGWFNDANSGYKPRILDRMAESPETVNASLNVAYKNYLDSNPKNVLSFDEWLDTPQTLYRGTRGQGKTADDIFTAFTPNKDAVAKKFAGKNGTIEEITITPRETYGSVMHNLESEFLVPESAIKESATPAPKVEATTKPKKSKTPPTREERLANANGVDQYNARAEHQAQRFEEGYEKADNVRAVLAGEEPKAPAKGTKPAAENLKTKAEASAPKPATKKEPRVIDDVGEVVHKRKAKVTRREKIKEFTESVRTKISDSLSAFEDEARKKSRDEMLDDYGAADKVRRHQTIANRSVIEHQQQWNGNRFSGEVTRNGHTFENGKSLKQIYDGMDEATEKDFDSYLLLKHAPDRIKEGKPIFDNTILKNGDSLNDPEVCRREAQKLLEKHPEFEAKAEEIYQYTQNELQNRVDAGLLSQDVADKWMKDHPFYVPTGRDMDEDFSVVYDSAVTGAQGLKAARGGDQAIRSVRDQLEYATTRNWRDMSMNNLFRRTFGDDIANELAKEADGGIEKVLDNTIDLHAGKDGKFYANVFVDGEKKSIEIEKKFYDAVQDLYKNGRLGNGIDVLNDAASIPAGVFKNLITEYSPIFMIKNFMRDFPEAFINTRQTKEFVESMLPALKDLATGGEYTQALKDAGISQSTFIDFDKALKSGNGKKNLFAIGNEYTELFPRLVEYMATFKKAGVSLKDADMALRDRAAANAADVTVNFGRSGSVGKMLNKGFVPFFNPSVQGWSKFARNLTELRHADAKTALSFALKATTLGAGARTINNFMLQDNPNYQNISARDKANNYIFPLGDAKKTDKFLKIPSSRFAAVYGLPSVNAFNKNKMGWAEAIKVAKDQVAPIDPLESNIFSQALQIKNNQTWYGTPIVPKALEDLPKSEQYDVNTSWFGKQLGKATENLPKELQISPKKADYAIDALTGVIGDFALPASTPSKRGNSVGESIRKTAARQFTIDTVTQNNLSTRFYDKLQEANTNNQSSKGGKAEADEYKRLNGFSTEISKVNAAIKDLQGSKRETKLDDVRGMQKFRNQLMQDALDGNDAPSSNKTMNTVQKYAGTTYAINHFGKQVDKDAMKNYGKKKYGDISNAEMRKAINDDKGFFKGVKAIGNLEERIVKAGTTSNTTLTKAVALAGAKADDDLFGAYGAIYKSRTETANKMTRARNYFDEGGSEKEYTKLELARRTLGKLPEDQKKSELDKLEKQLAKGEVDWAERDAREKSIEYNANISYIGLAASLAQANAPARGYRLYDIKDKNIQKGINLAAMGFTARDYKEMSKALDTNGNGYPSKQEIIDYVSKSNVKDKATLFDALYYYQGKSNPFGTPTKYTREQAALMGKKNGVKAISGESEDIKLNPDEGSSGNGYRGYYRGGYRRWHRWGSYQRKGRKPIGANSSAFKAKKANIASGSKVSVPNVSSTTSAPKINITPLNIKPVTSGKSGSRKSSNGLAAALDDIKKTEKKVAPPKARR